MNHCNDFAPYGSSTDNKKKYSYTTLWDLISNMND
jgi:hypothetical protein